MSWKVFLMLIVLSLGASACVVGRGPAQVPGTQTSFVQHDETKEDRGRFPLHPDLEPGLVLFKGEYIRIQDLILTKQICELKKIPTKDTSIGKEGKFKKLGKSWIKIKDIGIVRYVNSLCHFPCDKDEFSLLSHLVKNKDFLNQDQLINVKRSLEDISFILESRYADFNNQCTIGSSTKVVKKSTVDKQILSIKDMLPSDLQ